MRGRTLVLSSLLAVAMGPSWGCKVSVNEGDLDNNTEEDLRDAGSRNDGGGTAGKPPKPPKAGSGAGGSGSTADGGVAGSSSQAGRGGAGGASGGAGTGSSTPVPGNTMLMDLDGADATALCEQFADEVSEIVTDDDAANVLCTVDALFLSMDPQTGEVDVASCEEEVDSCVELGLYEGTTECEVDDLSAAANCEATVTEYLDCNRGLAQQYADFAEQFTCTTLSEPEAVEDAILAIDPDKVPACVTLLDKCPELGGEG